MGAPTPRLSAAIFANFAGSLWGVIISVAFVPFYLRYLGPEGYGVVGFSTTLLLMMSFLDAGLTLTVNREFAKLSGVSASASQMRDTLSAVTILFVGLGAVIASAIWLFAPSIARYWLNSNKLPVREIVFSLRLIGVVVGGQLLTTMYRSALFGLHRQVSANLVQSISLTARALGAAFILKFLRASPGAFFAWYCVVLLVQVLVVRAVLEGCIGPGRVFVPPKTTVIKTLLRQTRGLGAISILSLLLSQVDKLLVSRLLPLQEFGYYMVGVSISMLPLLICGPITNAFFPRMTQLAHSASEKAKEPLHFGTQLIGALAVPAGLTIALFAREAIFAWTGNRITTDHVAPIVTILIAGYSVNATLQMSYWFEVAHGRTRIPMTANVFAVILIVPAVFFGSQRFGALGAAAGWLVLNLGYLTISVPIMLRRSLGQAGFRQYYLQSLLPPYAITLVVAGTARLFAWDGLSRISGALVTITVAAVATFTCVAMLPSLRSATLRCARMTYALLSSRA